MIDINAIYDDDDQVDWLINEIGNRETALRMVNTAVLLSRNLDYPFPVVTDGKHGKVGIRYSQDCLMTGFGLAVGSRDD